MNQQRILLIEDDEDLINLYRIGLEKEGFKVFTSQNGMQGISEAIQQDLDLILLDMMMPLADGRDVLSMLKLNERTNQIPIIIISNLNPGTTDLTDLDDQVMEYWLKSELTPSELCNRITRYFAS